jgi:hypothetical protein
MSTLLYKLSYRDFVAREEKNNLFKETKIKNISNEKMNQKLITILAPDLGPVLVDTCSP